MKILFVVPSLKSGGLERVASLLSSNWALKEGIEVNLLTLDSKPSFYEIDENVRLHQAPNSISAKHRWVKAIMLWFWLRKQANNIDPDIILSFGEGYNAFVVANLSNLNKPIFLSNRTTPLTSLIGIRGLINPIFYKRANRVFVQTSKSIEILSAKYKGTNFEVIPNPIKEILNTPDYTKKTILNVGSIGGKKNQLGLIRVFHKLSTKFPDWQLVFAGDGPDRFKLEEYVKKNNLEGRVRFEGLVKDLNRLYNEVSIFAFTSLLEGFPNALGEAMSAGMAVIAYDCLTGPADLIKDEENGFLIELENEVMFRKKLFRLMNNTELRAALGNRAKLSIENLNIAQISNSYLEYFNESLLES